MCSSVWMRLSVLSSHFHSIGSVSIITRAESSAMSTQMTKIQYLSNSCNTRSWKMTLGPLWVTKHLYCMRWSISLNWETRISQINWVCQSWSVWGSCYAGERHRSRHECFMIYCRTTCSRRSHRETRTLTKCLRIWSNFQATWCYDCTEKMLKLQRDKHIWLNTIQIQTLPLTNLIQNLITYWTTLRKLSWMTFSTMRVIFLAQNSSQMCLKRQSGSLSPKRSGKDGTNFAGQKWNDWKMTKKLFTLKTHF